MNKYPGLSRINSPDDLRKIKGTMMPALAKEIRTYLVENITKSGGHLASNLGVVELTLALHRHFKTPHDHIIWDVGHQSYVHKLITGRRKGFENLRVPGGLSGFTKRSESVHDCFGAGHSSTSLSAALGFAESDARKGSDAYTVVVLGDGAFTGGMIHEAINNCREDLRLIIIINENEMSISRNEGKFARHMTRMRSSKNYFKFKTATVEIVEKIPYIGKSTADFMRDTKQILKNAIYASNYFEEMGLYYMGPVDGNDYEAVSNILEVAKALDRSTVIHVTTKKGYGYKPAENNPRRYHMVPKGGPSKEAPSFSSKLGEALVLKAAAVSDVCAITAAMPHGTGLEYFKNKFPRYFYDVGIAEEHAATFAAGLAANGMKPFFACYSSFLQRAYDSIIHDIALQNLPVTLCIDRTGLNEGDGATHHGIFDVSFLSAIPNMEIYTPVTYNGLKKALDCAYSSGRPCAVRYPKGEENERIRNTFYPNSDHDIQGVRTSYGDSQPECVIVTYGDIAIEALKAEALFADMGIECGTVLLEMLKPYDCTAQRLISVIPYRCKNIVFLEEGIRNGGASVCIIDKLKAMNAFSDTNIKIFAIDDDFAYGEKGKTLRETCKLRAEDIVEGYKEENNL